MRETSTERAVPAMDWRNPLCSRGALLHRRGLATSSAPETGATGAPNVLSSGSHVDLLRCSWQALCGFIGESLEKFQKCGRVVRL
ncbi:hypothetical protein FLM9_725 [Candidatus Synechococcus spongiarum]|uniref:Uncharacterized protein n=1 Tax=Candidatus Synechococcus spongiarum TaxID=431041 RepID=A0A171DGF4_9SYNE|nr:hypothetical protein FLM9_725 [Candidatus Synechococcus spongiarum]